MSAAAVPAPDPPKPAPWTVTDAKSVRFYVLLRWMHEIGVCGLCAMVFSIRLVEHEAGAEWDPQIDPCERRDKRGRTCRQLLDLHWPARPKPPARKP